MSERAVFLDRDGVLNETVFDGTATASPRTPDELVIVDDAAVQTRRLRHAGYLLFVVTNQPDVARGRLRPDDADAMNRSVVERLGLDGYFMCPHDTADRCRCRKPEAGMIDGAIVERGLRRDACWLIGDRWVDIAAAQAAGVRSVLLTRPWSWLPTGSGAPPAGLEPDLAAGSLEACVDAILAAS